MFRVLCVLFWPLEDQVWLKGRIIFTPWHGGFSAATCPQVIQVLNTTDPCTSSLATMGITGPFNGGREVIPSGEDM